MLRVAYLLAAGLLLCIEAQNTSEPLPNSFPNFYPGIPNHYLNFNDSKAWQDYFLIKDKLPNATFSLERSFAGNLPVKREGHLNNTLFFWAWEKSNGSLANAGDDDQSPWVIWLNGGPGSSSMLGLLFENGPIHVTSNYSLVKNDFGWNTLADTIWVDQPIGTGYSTADSQGYIFSEDQMGEDFMGFLSNLVQVFPSLAKMPLYLTGESYAGTYIPYITKTYFSMQKPPVHLVKIAIGDGTLGSQPVFEDVSVAQILETYPQLIDYDTEVFNYFKEQLHLCGYDVNLTYPMNGPLPSLLPNFRSDDNGTTFASLGRPKSLTNSAFKAALSARLSIPQTKLSRRELYEREERKTRLKRNLIGRSNGTIDPFYECFLLFELIDYAVNFTAPWSIGEDTTMGEPGFDVYSIPDALDPEALQDGSLFLNDPVTRAALHAPISKNWTESFSYPFENNASNAENPGTNQFGDPSVEPMAFLSDLATNSSKQNISWVIYSGNDDYLVGHRGTEVSIQNITFGGITGFTKRPSSAWFGDDHQFSGIVHQERNVTFVLFDKAGHLIPQWQPSRALTFVREFVLGNNANGTVLPNGDIVGENAPQFVNDILPAEHDPIFTGSGVTAGSTVWPSATIDQWVSFIASAAATDPASSNSSSSSSNQNGAERNIVSYFWAALFSAFVSAMVMLV